MRSFGPGFSGLSFDSPGVLFSREQSGAEPDIRVRIRPRIIAVQIEHAGIGSIVPVAAAISETLTTHSRTEEIGRSRKATPDVGKLSDMLTILPF